MRFSTAAFSSSTAWASGDTSLLSSSKKTGFSGELRFRSSSDAEAMPSSRTGSGGTTVGSATGTGGAGGREPAVVVPAGGVGRVGRATGGCLLPQAAARTTVNRTGTKAAFADRASSHRVLHISFDSRLQASGRQLQTSDSSPQPGHFDQSGW